MGFGDLTPDRNIVQILHVVYTPEELKKVKEELSLRGREFITRFPDYTYEISISQEELSFVVSFCLRPKTLEELDEMYGDY